MAKVYKSMDNAHLIKILIIKLYRSLASADPIIIYLNFFDQHIAISDS